MRRICIAAIVAGTLSSPGFAQSLRPSYAPDGTSQSAHSITTKRIPRAQKAAAKTAPAHEAAESGPAAAQSYAEPAPEAPAPNRGLHDFFATIFAGPLMLANAFHPAQSQYPAMSSSNLSIASVPSTDAAAIQTDPRDYPVDPKFLRQEVAYPGREAPGTIIVDTTNKFLYLIEDDGRALRYGIGVGRPGFLWAGVKTVTAKREWPDWRPPAEMIARRPDLPRFMPGGIDNPLGARALYLGSSLYRIHGSNEPWTIGTSVSSGCIRMRNEDVTDLYQRVKVGTKVVVI
jgi:lipoprotein-anchoring transpeptidase ErfK/SrfK